MKPKELTVYLVKLLILFAAYFVTARIGLSLDAVSGFATLVWPPTGISFAALLLFGTRLWPGIFLAAAIVNFSVGAPFLVALGIGAGNTLGPIFAVYLFKKITTFNNLERLRCALALMVVSLVSTLVSATIGTTSLLLGAEISLAEYTRTWWAWWVGDSLGILLVGSLLLLNWKSIFASKLNYKTLLHFFVIELTLIFSSMAAFWGTFDAASILIFYFIFSPLIWAALRFGQNGGVVAIFSMTFIAIWGAVGSYGPFAEGTLTENLLAVQLFMGSVAINILVLGAVVSERKRAERELNLLNENLESKIVDRTKELVQSENRYRLLSEDLEKKVAERTGELDDKVSDLEKLNKFMVGRELKMIELKDELHGKQIQLENLRAKVPVKKSKPAKGGKK